MTATAGTRFPLATGAQVRREVGRQIRRIRHARSLFLLALLLLGVGAYAGVLIPQLMGRIVDLVQSGDGTSLWVIGAALGGAALTGGALAWANWLLDLGATL